MTQQQQQDFPGFSGASMMNARRQTDYLGPPASQSQGQGMGQNNNHVISGRKDLIIRMLAEVFRVNNYATGHSSAKWEQISSSLVPISLYSRTTNKWLNYLLRASSSINNNNNNLANSGNQNNAMSPDSRDFLILLQQFHHHQQQQQHMQQFRHQQSGPANGQPSGSNCLDDPIVFQVVAHDFVDGQCKKVLNLKLAQPGSRLGQASDYFVYWRERSPNSNSSINQQCCQLQQRRDNPFPDAQPPTWGLNFASVNDAKLFYDICSLNLVDLDFNSDYLKLLSMNYDKSASLACHQTPQLNQQQMPISNSFIPYKRSQQAASNSRKQQAQQQLLPSTSSKCTSCKQVLRHQQQLSQQLNQASMQLDSSCPIHGRCTSAGLNKHNSASMRVRSRSSTRQSTCDSSIKARSYSTPASPDHKQPSCPVHNNPTTQQREQNRTRNAVNVECNTRQSHHPRCISYINQQQKQSTESETKPVKPARGFLREQNENAVMKPSQSNHLANYTRQQSSHANRVQLSANECQFARNYQGARQQRQQQQTDISSATRKLRDAQDLGDQQASHKFINSRSAQRRSTGIETKNLNQFESHRNASLARAQYANSKNMKEFLSLDAGGVQATPNHQKEKLDHRMNMSESANARNNQSTSSQQQQQQILSSSTFNQQLKPSSNIRGESSSDGCEGKDPNDPSALVNNASTTTDDLPLDAQTKKRMFKLISEEVISERTEPKSLSINNSIIASGNRGNYYAAQAHQERAISLGPEVNKESRGRQVRSDIGRRRSLERSLCVDLDSTQPMRLAFKHSFKGVSPLPQSVSPMVVESSPSYGNDANSVLASSNRNKNDDAIPTKQATKKRARTKSSGEGECCSIRKRYTTLLKADDGMNNLESKICQHHDSGVFNGERSTCFKSAPNISRLCGVKADCFFDPDTDYRDGSPLHYAMQDDRLKFVTNCDHKHNHHYHHHLRTQGQQQFQGPSPLAGLPVTRTVPGLSSYAVPLCCGDERDQQLQQRNYGRQCHSCPNSLRRKRKRPLQTNEYLQQAFYQDSSVQMSHSGGCQSKVCLDNAEDFFRPSSVCHGTIDSGQPYNLQHSSCICKFCASFVKQDEPETDRLAFHQSVENCMSCKLKMRQYAQFEQRSRQHQCHRYPCIDEVHADVARNVDDKRFLVGNYAPSGSAATSALQPFRTFSSQSSKSPMHYGLYESDCEDESPAPANQPRDNLCQTKPKHLGKCDLSDCESRNRLQAVYYDNANTKPVRGYDQTMSRSSLKTRQRAKSQPPKNEINDNTFHLTKSMENVQKLIKEVQIELDVISRRRRSRELNFFRSSATTVDFDVNEKNPHSSRDGEKTGRQSIIDKASQVSMIILFILSSREVE